MKNKATLFEDDKVKILRSPEINFNFSKITGRMETWGKTKEEDPFYSPYGPLHLDMEIADGDSCPISCQFCSPEGTQINTPFGKVNIEKLQTGDLVIGFDVEKESVTIQEIEEIYSRDYSGELICLELDNGEVLKLTPEHEVFTKNKGWIMVKLLEIVDEVIFFE